MNEFLENLKKEAAANPLVAMGIAAALLTAAGKFVNASSWKREVARRAAKDALKKR